MTLPPFTIRKPLDFGANGITGSLTTNGRLIALNAYDADVGYITLTSAEAFPDADRYDPGKVRAYRSALPRLTGFGITFEPRIRDHKVAWVADTDPHVTLSLINGDIVPIATVPVDSGAVQFVMPSFTPMRFAGRISLQRCAYTQLTEGGVIPMPPLKMHIVVKDGTLTIHNPALGRAAAISGIAADEQMDVTAYEPVELDLRIAPNTSVLTYQFGTTPDDARAATHALRSQLGQIRMQQKQPLGEHPANLMARRGLVYGRQMCIPVADSLCILTDHMLLPLSWNRDAYYVALALLHGLPDGADLVRRHILWMFEVADRPDGDWGRCYLANGRVKDGAYQLDQQLYPILELADYTLFSGDQTLLERVSPQVRSVLDGLERHRHQSEMLYATDETPGDDPIAQPFHLSSHILMWRMLTQWARATGDDDWARRAETLRATIQHHFVVQTPSRQTMYAYAVDGQGGFHLYHDANDLPLALAPAWGYCSADDPVWKATVEYAFSSANSACFDGRLGSVHTPAPWALGDLQDVIISRAMGDSTREERAWERLSHGAHIDGALPEAYDGATGEVISRTWFAWPNATAACIALGCWDSTGASA